MIGYYLCNKIVKFKRTFCFHQSITVINYIFYLCIIVINFQGHNSVKKILPNPICFHIHPDGTDLEHKIITYPWRLCL